MNGIALHVDGEQLDLGAAKVRLRIQSPLFQPEFVRQSYSYPFTLPWTPKNARLFHHAERMANVENIVELATDIYVAGLFWKSGVLKYRRYRNGYDCDLLIPPDAIITTLGNTNLQDVDLGVFDTADEAYFSTFSDLDDRYSEHTADFPDVPFVFAPIKITKPLGDAHYYDYFEDQVGYVPDPRPGGYANHYDAGATYKWFMHVGTLPNDGEWIDVFTPFPYLRSVLDAVMALVGRSLTSTLAEEDEFKRMVVVGNLLQLAGFVTTGTTATSVDQSYLVMNPAKGLPNISCIEFIVALQKRFNARFIFSATGARFVTVREVLDTYDIFDATNLAIPEFDVELQEADGYKLDEVEDPMDALGSDRNVAQDVIIQHTVNSVEDLAGLTPDSGDVALVLSAAALYKNNGFFSATWEYHMPYLPGVVVGSGSVGLDVGVAMTKMHTGLDGINGGRSWLTPEVDLTLSERQERDIHGVGRHDLSVLRLLFYRGLQQDSNGSNYPLLTNGLLDYDGNAITGAEWTERIEGAGGIHDTWYKSSLALNSAKRVQRKVRLALADMLHYDFTRKMHIDSINYLVDAIDVEFTVDSVGIPRLDLVKV